VLSQSNDCATVLSIYKAMGGVTTLTNGCQIPGVTASGTTVTAIQWGNSGLYGAIPKDIGKLSYLQLLYLGGNRLTGQIPIEIGNLSELLQLGLSDNLLTGPIPKEIGKLLKLRRLYAKHNQLSGVIPTEIGNLSNMTFLFLNDNKLTGAPSSLSKLRKTAEKMVILPNPMSAIPYDVFSVNPAAVLSPTNWTTLLNVPVLYKRTLTSSMSALELYQLCPLNDFTNKEVVAGCVAGIYNNLCKDKADLVPCQSAYDKVVSQSYFAPLGVCAAWKFGPKSFPCQEAIYNFVVKLDYITLTRTHANDFVTSTLASKTYAPCTTTSTVTCKW